MAHEAAEQNGRTLALSVDELEGMELPAQIRHAAGALRAQGAVAPEFQDAALADAVRGVKARVDSGSAYEPGRFAGTLTLFRASESGERHERFFATRGEDERRTFGWTPLAAEPVEVHPVPGSHVTLGSEPNVRTLARQMREALAAARERAAWPSAGPSTGSSEDAASTERTHGRRRKNAGAESSVSPESAEPVEPATVTTAGGGE